MNKVQTYFKDFPHKDKVFETSDGYMFHEKGDANLHAQSLKDKEVVTHFASKNIASDDDAAKADAAAKKAEAEAKKAADVAAKKAEADAKKAAAAAAKKAEADAKAAKAKS